MPYWACKVTIIEHRREALIEAATKTEAIQKIRGNDWASLGDAEYYTVQKSGPVIGPVDKDKWEGGSWK